MKTLILVAGASALLLFIGCDKVNNNAYPETGTNSGGLNWELYPDGDSAHYVQNHWPVWNANTNTLPNVLIEDFTGHQCPNCPGPAEFAHSLEVNNPGRVFSAGIHTSYDGLSDFQETNSFFTNVFYNPASLEIGTYFGSQPGSSFIGNPHGAVNRMLTGTDNTCPPGSWSSKTTTALNSTLKINIQAEHNYFPSTRGLFLHTEVDVLDNSIDDDLGLVVYLLEDSLIGPQTYFGDIDTFYVHRNIFRGCIDNKAFGRKLTASDLGGNGKYYVNYAYKLPDEYNPENMHLLIYVYNKESYEIYQVIEEEVE